MKISARRSGFSLIELVVVMALIAIMAIMVVPNMKKPATLQPQEFVAKLNDLMQTAWQRALLFNRVQQIKFNFSEKKIVLLEERTSIVKTKKEDNFVPVTGTYHDSELAIPAGYSFNSFYRDDQDELRRSGATTTAWFFLMPSGMTQSVIINTTFIDEDHPEQPVWKFGMVLNPFSAQFEYYDTFQHP